ncbi:putative LRR receptor-like serine/threonine-protein kinase [Prunus yedoensis var. nudiflora]|uniref:Putative LRR receptor-like serine/threonine-protein kinase n=1 Tax=Prunus yedoensis var. nudiflora TaxID=2094558 RepID=A0A314XR07_PRUYE|nr:putative LRR receptor-like serine/threonine-protein kinase [Prunus yedoensis var. nudiflora]
MEGQPRLLLSISLTLLLLCITRGPVAAQITNFTTDQSALLALKSHITSDPHNILTANWSTDTSICNWVGVTCGIRHLRVTALNLSYMGLTGTIPPHLGNLSFLVELHFRNNSFHAWFGSLSKLQAFSIFGNQFSGSIPVAIFNLSALQVINMDNNQLSGSIPREIGNLTMLKVIRLDDNNFKEIPNEIGTLDQVESLSVQSNTLTGPVSMGVFNMSSLTTLSLYGNNLNGGIPDNICQHLPKIQELFLGLNQFDGPLPSKLWQCKKLLVFVLENNNFSGSIPKNIGNLNQLMEIYIASNNLTGTIPDEIGDLHNLQVYSFGVNNLNGPIPSTIFNMSMITTISLASNQLSGSLPADIDLRLPNLELLYVGMNKLSGVIPKFSSKLTQLEMGGNSFTGFVPSSLCALTNLDFLSLHTNNLTIDTSTPEANFLSCLANLRNLMGLYLGNNPLQATLPVAFGNLSPSFEYLYLDNCKLRGNIPSDIGNLSNLIALDMEGNQLSGSIPTSVGRLGNLQGLYLNDNQLQGHIPYHLCQLQNLAELFLGGNQLSGSLPSCLDNFSAALRILSLGPNLLTSTIPSTLWGLEYILNLDLSSNLLNGSLSEEIGKLSVMTTLNLSNNNLSGSVPSSIGGLQDLVNLSLANNNLEGLIPSSFGKLLSLELLDLSKNNMSGVIPESLEALVHLNYLNFSFNRLQGEIPTGGAFQNFSAQSFISNGALCGAAGLHVPQCKNSTHKPNSRKASSPNLKYLIPGIISAILLVASAAMFILHRKRKVEVATETTLLPQLIWRRVSRLELPRATNGFQESNLIGTGGFGSVYKGRISDGIDVAVKVLNLQLEGAFKSFDSECEVLSNIRHRNLIKIISCCSQIDFKALVLQYMPNGSLEKWLYSQNSPLNILQRLNIMTDVASALEYLHHSHGYSQHVVHCDVKPSNILLDDDMVAHVADFGMARLLGGGDSMTQTMTLATIGYMAPEFGMEGIVSTKGDVYSFGIAMDCKKEANR